VPLTEAAFLPGGLQLKKIGFLSFGHWTDSYGSHVRSAADSLRQSIELAVAAEELGADGAYFRVHHFARQLGSPFPLLAAVGARTRTIEIGTAVIDMRYENALYMAEEAGAADLIAGGRLQLGISRGSPEQVIDGWRYFGYAPAEGESDAEMARRQAERFLDVITGQGFAKPNPRPMFPKEHVLSIWNGEFDQTREWGGLVTMVLHPQVTGRPMRLGIFREFIARVRGIGDAWLATGEQIARHYAASETKLKTASRLRASPDGFVTRAARSEPENL